MACASSSPSMTCSVKFFDPTTTVASPTARSTDHADQQRRSTPPRRRDAGRSDQSRTTDVECDAPATPEHAVGNQRERRRRNRARENRRAVDHRQPAEDVLAEPARADRRRNRGRADADHGRHAEAGHDRRQRQRQLDHQQQLPRRHAHGDAGLDDRRGRGLAVRRRSCGRSAAARRASARRARCAVRRRR